MNILIIDNKVDAAEQRALYFGFKHDHNVDLAYKRDDAIDCLNLNQYDVIFLDVLLSGKNWMDSILILEEIYNEKKKHGVVFLITQLAKSITTGEEPELSKELSKYPIDAITTPIDEYCSEPEEYEYIKSIIGIIGRTVVRHSSDKDPIPKYIISIIEIIKFLVAMFVWTGGIILIPSLLNYSDLNEISPGIRLLISSIPGILVTTTLYVDHVKLLVRPLLPKINLS